MLSDFEAAFEGVEREIVRAEREDGKRSWGYRELLDLIAGQRLRCARDETAIEELFRRFGPEMEALFTNKAFSQMLVASEDTSDQLATTEDPAQAGPAGMQRASDHRRSTPDGEEHQYGRTRGHQAEEPVGAATP